jgi:hypothetical protein
MNRMSWNSQALLVFLAASAILPKEAAGYLCIMVALVLGFLRKGLEVRLAQFVFPLGAIGLVAAVAGVDNTPFNYLKDAWYICRPISLLMLGFWASKATTVNSSSLRCFHLNGLLALICVFFVWALQIVFGYGEGIPLKVLTTSSLQCGLSIGAALSLSSKRTRVQCLGGSWGMLSYAVGLLCLASLVYLESRTWLSCTVLFVFAERLLTSSRSAQRMAFALLGVLTGVAFIWVVQVYGLGSRGGDPGSTALVKIYDELSIQESFWSDDVNRRWRGHEAFLALDEYRDTSLARKVVGFGLGKTVVLESPKMLGGMELGEIGHLHNGYAWVALKAGALGLALFIYWLFTLFSRGRAAMLHADEITRGYGRILICGALVLAFSTLTVSGPYNPSGCFPVLCLLGFLSERTTRRPIREMPK